LDGSVVVVVDELVVVDDVVECVVVVLVVVVDDVVECVVVELLVVDVDEVVAVELVVVEELIVVDDVVECVVVVLLVVVDVVVVDVVDEGAVVVVVEGDTTGALHVQVASSQSWSPGQPSPLSHCSPLPGSTTPSPQNEYVAVTTALNLDLCALKLPVSAWQAGSIVAASEGFPCSPAQLVQIAVSFVPWAFAFCATCVSGQAVPKEILPPVMAMNSGAESRGSRGAPCTT